MIYLFVEFFYIFFLSEMFNIQMLVIMNQSSDFLIFFNISYLFVLLSRRFYNFIFLHSAVIQLVYTNVIIVLNYFYTVLKVVAAMSFLPT